MKRTIDYKAVIALLKAANRVRNGQWIKGAPSHIFPELLTELEKDGWRLIDELTVQREVLMAGAPAHGFRERLVSKWKYTDE